MSTAAQAYDSEGESLQNQMKIPLEINVFISSMHECVRYEFIFACARTDTYTYI